MFLLGPWLSLSSLHFTVVTNAGEPAGRAALERLERLRPVVGAPPSNPEIVLFQSLEDFREAFPKEAAAGLFQTGPGFKRIVASDLRSLVHEYVHAVNEEKGLPLWQQEGLASFYAASRFDDRGTWIGATDPGFLATLRNSPPLTMEELAAVDRSSPRYRENLFYAQSWALTYSMMTGRQPQELAPPRFVSAPVVPREIRIRELSQAEEQFLKVRLTGAGLEALVREYPDFVPGLEARGLGAFARYDFDEALADFEQALTLGSERPQTAYLSGLLLLHYSHDFQKAEQRLSQAATLEPGNRSYLAAWEWARDSVARQDHAELLGKVLAVNARPTADLSWAANVLPPPAVVRPPAPRVPPRWLTGTLAMVDCKGPAARLDVLLGEKTIRLLIRGPYGVRMPRDTSMRFTCGPQMKPIRLAYRPVRDLAFNTEGDVVALAP